MSGAHGVVRLPRIAAALGALLPGAACAHAFGERYDLPVPLAYFVAGAAATVGLSFVVATLFMRRIPREHADNAVLVPLGFLMPSLRALCRVTSVALLCMVLLAGFYGTRNPEMNLGPILVWIIWWVGLSFFAACIGNIWPALDPWRAVFEWLDEAVRRLGLAKGITPCLAYPSWLGAWPAVCLLLLFVWIEVLYPHAVLPPHLATIVLGWSAFTILGMTLFGGDVWRRNADVFHIYFATLGRFAPVTQGPDGRTIALRPLGHGLIDAPAGSAAMVGFVIAMLATVLFDGLLGTQAMTLAHRALNAWVPGLLDRGGFVLGTAGLLGVWALFLAAYYLSCAATARLVQGRPVARIAQLFAFTLVPIAIAYNIAHYFSYLLVHGQLIIPVISDPLGRGWDLFNTMQFYPDIGIVTARFSWYLAIVAIVAGHIVSIWLAHRLALREFRAPREAVIASIPLTLLMIAYTAISLLVMAEPLAQFVPADTAR